MPLKTRYAFVLLVICLTISFSSFCQNELNIKAQVDPDTQQIHVQQSLKIYNNTPEALNSIILLDWNNSFSSNATELALRFEEEYSNKFYFANADELGHTIDLSIKQNSNSISYTRPSADLILVDLQEPISPGKHLTLNLEYTLKLPSDKFTRFGIDKKGNIKLDNWCILPATLSNDNKAYSNKDLDDLYYDNLNLNLEFTYPDSYTLYSDLNSVSKQTSDSKIKEIITGNDRVNFEIHLIQSPSFSEIATDKFTYVANLDDEGIGLALKAVIHDKIAFFLNERLGEYHHKKLILSESYYKRNPVYGLNQLPDFIRPFPDGFQYEIKVLKATISKYLRQTLNVNPRTDYWINNALENYLIIKYIEVNYPNMKILGNLSKIWGIRSLQIAKKDFNDQYNFLYQYMSRINLDQPIQTQKDSLLKFNNNISNKNKAGIGLKLLEDYLNEETINTSIKSFYKNKALQPVKSNDFITTLESNTNKNLNWFVSSYIKSDTRIDYTIKEVKNIDDTTLEVTLENKTGAVVPIPIYQIKDKSVTSKHYIDGFTGTKTVTIPNNNPDKLILNYEEIVPEFNQRNNTKTIKPHLLNKPIKFSFLKDAEAPNHNQVFYMPQLGYNLYDGFSPGLRFTNKPILKKQFNYSIKPLYGLTSKKLVGSASAKYTQYFKRKSLFSIVYGLTYQTYHYETDLQYQRFNPYVVFSYRKKDDLRSNFKQRLVARTITVNRDQSPLVDTDPNYTVFNTSYGLSDRNLLNLYSFYTDLQLAKDFGKISATLEYRKTFTNNRQINIRTFLGTFLYNNTNSDFFSFALDRPTDYLFDYNYYGRSEDTGIYSQQIIIAEGGFKSKLNTPLANDWIATTNVSTNIWKYIFAYGDLGYISNNNTSHFVYDSGVHLNLVPDYFELYFPVYSNLGWEVAQQNYHEKIRFKLILTPKVLIGLFTRKWH